MKVLVDGIPRSIGGIGSLIINLVRCSKECDDKNRLEFELIVPEGSLYIKTLDRLGYKYHLAPPVHNLLLYRLFLKGIFSESHYDYLWFNNTSKVNIMLVKYAKQNGTKIIAHPHGVSNEEKGFKRIVFSFLDKINERKMYSLIDIPFSCSEEAADVYYKGNRELRTKTVIIRNGIFVSRFSFSEENRIALRKELEISDDEFLIGLVGRLTKVKNYPFAIDLLSKLDHKYKMIILGDGEDREELENRIKEKNVQGRCFLLGMQENIPDYLSAMDCFLLPSFNEGLPYSVVEAQCEGLPCIVSDSLSNELQITDLVSFLPLEKIDKWVDMIQGLHNGHHNRASYVRQIQNAGYDIEQTYHLFLSELGG